jgi:hypothetical protein
MHFVNTPDPSRVLFFCSLLWVPGCRQDGIPAENAVVMRHFPNPEESDEERRRREVIRQAIGVLAIGAVLAIAAVSLSLLSAVLGWTEPVSGDSVAHAWLAFLLPAGWLLWRGHKRRHEAALRLGWLFVGFLLMRSLLLGLVGLLPAIMPG